MESLSSKRRHVEALLEELLNLKAPLAMIRRKSGVKPVLGEGNLNAKIVFIGEAPGKNEALTGRPFAGMAGRVLDELLASIKLKRQDVYITNLVNDRPPNNRVPTQKEIAAYERFLHQLLLIIQPKVIVPLGRTPMTYLFDRFDLKIDTIGKLHGRAIETKTPYGTATIIPLYHPAAVLYNRHLQDDLKRDIRKVKNYL
ncbi:MAG TPA: uracil-DNA glycosylase [Patescibacteria group bacterium]|nr:uracil-DNA glycosylase [Patescibacteria group bacterium]